MFDWMVFFPGFQEETIKIFEAHRNQFLADDDLQKIAAKLGRLMRRLGAFRLGNVASCQAS